MSSQPKKAQYIGKVPLDFIKLPSGIADWQKYETEDLFATGLVTCPPDYVIGFGSAVLTPRNDIRVSLATTPSYQLPINTQYYMAGRDIIRWGGKKDPDEYDFDRYVFTPNFEKEIAYVSLAPKSEPHHLSEMPNYIHDLPQEWRDVIKNILGMK